MDEKTARKILGDNIQEDGRLFSSGWYLNWNEEDDDATLDGRFNADDLEAIAWWMRNKKPN